jgi:hypothetical protein
MRFGAKSDDHFTGHLDEARKQRYLKRHKKKKTGKNIILQLIGLAGFFGNILHIKKVIKEWLHHERAVQKNIWKG